MFEEMIESYLAKLKEIEGYDVKSVILFGSVARGQAKEHSDIDIIVVASGLPELRNRDALPPFFKLARTQDIWMTPEELEDMVIAKTGTEVEDTIIMDNCMISKAGKIVESLIGRNVRIQEGIALPKGNRFIVGDNSEISL